MNDGLVVVIAALVGSIPSIYAIIAGKRKSDAEARKARAEAVNSISDAAVQLVDPLRCENRVLREDLAKLKVDMEAQEQRLSEQEKR